MSLSRLLLQTACLLGIVFAGAALAHEGHDHDKPPPLNLPIAPRVIAVTPDYELVGVRSGTERLSIFLHRFATGEPVEDAQLELSVGDDTRVATPAGPGLFDFTSPWIGTPGTHDIMFSLTIPSGQDLLVGSLDIPAAAGPQKASAGWLARLRKESLTVAVGLGGTIAGILLTLLFRGRKRQAESSPEPGLEPAEDDARVTAFRRASHLLLFAAITLWGIEPLGAADMAPDLPAIPSTMATDMPQRLPDGTLFVPKSTQHLLSLRTSMTVEAESPQSVELTGTVVAAPNNTSRIQVERPGRLEAPEGGLAYLGKRVAKGELLGFVVPFMEAFDRATIESQIAETEGRIAQQTAILNRYRERPGAVPQVRVDEVEGELDALKKRRSELLPSRAHRDEIRAPIDGVVSTANISIGQVVEMRDVLFEIVDPSEFWIEAVAFDVQVLDNFGSAVAVSHDGRSYPLEFIGKGLILRQQATPLTFRFAKPPESLAIGKPIKVVLHSTVSAKGFVLPASSIVRSQSGLPVVWIKAEPERFEPRPVRFELIDGRNVLVVSGLKPEQRVVTDGVTLINQIR